MTFDDGTDGLGAAAGAGTAAATPSLPEGITPELGPYATPIGELYRYKACAAPAATR